MVPAAVGSVCWGGGVCYLMPFSCRAFESADTIEQEQGSLPQFQGFMYVLWMYSLNFRQQKGCCPAPLGEEQNRAILIVRFQGRGKVALHIDRLQFGLAILSRFSAILF